MNVLDKLLNRFNQLLKDKEQTHPNAYKYQSYYHIIPYIFKLPLGLNELNGCHVLRGDP